VWVVDLQQRHRLNSKCMSGGGKESIFLAAGGLKHIQIILVLHSAVVSC